MKRRFSFEQSGSLGRRISQQVITLGVIAVLGLLALVGVGLQSAMQSTQNNLILARTSAANIFNDFLISLNDDLWATSDALASTSDYEDVFRRALERQDAIFELDYVNRSGRVLAQRRRVGEADVIISEQPWLETVQAGETYISSVDYAEFGVPFVIFAVPVTDDDGDFLGTLVSQTDLTALWRPVTNLTVGESGYGYITNADGILLAYQDLQLVQAEINTVDLIGQTPGEITGTGFNLFTGLESALVIASAEPLDIVPWFIIVEQPVGEALGTFFWLFLLLILLLVFVGVQANRTIRFTQRRIVEPLRVLQNGVSELQSGRMEHTIDIQTKDELGELASTFNSMAAQLQEMIGTLEQRVASRTKALATTTEVSRRLSTILDRSELVKEVVEQVQEAFDYYHAHIYLAEGDDLIMTGGTGEAGAEMLASGHKLEKGRGLVGRAAASNEPVLVADTTQDPDWLPNLLLPETKSEVAIPIAVGDQVMGVLDVQHDVTDGLGLEDMASLQSIATQVAIGLQNARLFEETQLRSDELVVLNEMAQEFTTGMSVDDIAETAYRFTDRLINTDNFFIAVYDEDTDQIHNPLTIEEGERIIIPPRKPKKGLTEYILDSKEALLLPNNVMEGAQALGIEVLLLGNEEPPLCWLGIPLMVGDKATGVMAIQSLETPDRYSDRDRDLMMAIGSQVAVALENARLYSSARRQAERETTLNLISQKIQNAATIEEAMQIAARELGHALGKRQTLVALDPAVLAGDRN